MEAGVQAAVQQVGRLRRGIGWPVVLAEGIVALVIGLAILVQPDTARSTLRQLLGAALLLTSGLGAIAAFRAFYASGREDAGVPFRLFGGGVGVTLGLLVVLEPFSGSVGGQVGRQLLTAGLLIYGLFDLVAGVAGFRSRGLALGSLLNGAVYLGLGLLLLANTRMEIVSIELYGVMAVAGGLLLIGYALWLRRSTRAAGAQAPATT
jgi:uncharacterized membrane protein HdeD (DUF308 family)